MLFKGKLTPARFPSWCTELTHISFPYSAMLLEEKLTTTRFPSWCNVFDNNVVVLDEKLPYES